MYTFTVGRARKRSNTTTSKARINKARIVRVITWIPYTSARNSMSKIMLSKFGDQTHCMYSYVSLYPNRKTINVVTCTVRLKVSGTKISHDYSGCDCKGTFYGIYVLVLTILKTWLWWTTLYEYKCRFAGRRSYRTQTYFIWCLSRASINGGRRY